MDNDTHDPAIDARSPRRDFLLRAGSAAGGLALALAGGCAQAQDAQAQASPPGGAPGTAGGDDVVLRLDEASPLAKAGGSQTIDTAEGKVIVAHVAQAEFVACSAVCTHKGGPIKYDAESGQLFCPWHGSRFDKTGKVLRPPARQPLQSYTPQSAVVVSLKK